LIQINAGCGARCYRWNSHIASEVEGYAMTHAEAVDAPCERADVAPGTMAFTLRSEALRVRWIAAELADATTTARLLGYASELDAQALAMECGTCIRCRPPGEPAGV
jgi:hypothetical protein